MLRTAMLLAVVLVSLSVIPAAFAGYDYGDDIGFPVVSGMDAHKLIQKAINDLKPINAKAAEGLQDMLDNCQINIGMGPDIEKSGAMALSDGKEGVEGDGINVNEGVMTGGLVEDAEGNETWKHDPNKPETCSGHDWNNFVAALAHEWVHANTGGIPMPTTADTSAVTDYGWEKPAYEKELAVLTALNEPTGWYPAPPGGNAVKTRRQQLTQELARKKKAAEEELVRKALGMFLCAPTGDGTAGGFACTVTDLAGEPVAVATWFADDNMLYCSVPTFESGVALELPVDDTYGFDVIAAKRTGIENDVVLVAGVSGSTGMILGYEVDEDELVGEVLRLEIPDCEPWSIRYREDDASLWVLDGSGKRLLCVEDTGADLVPDALAPETYATADAFPILATAHDIFIFSAQPGIGISSAGYGPYDLVNLDRPVTFLLDGNSDGVADAEVELTTETFARFAPRLLDEPLEGAMACQAFGVAGANVTLGTCDPTGVFLGEVLALGTVAPDRQLDLALSRPLIAGELIRLYDPLNELSEESGIYEVPPAGWNREPRAYAAELQLLPQTCASGALVTLDGSATYDLDSDPLDFEWQEVVDSYDDCPVLGTGPILSVWMTPGVHSVRLIVNDGEADQRTYMGVGVIPYYGHFPDVPGPNDDAPDEHWAFWEVEACAQNNVVTGYGDGSYQPSWQVSRAQMAVYIARALLAPEGDAGLDDYTPPTAQSFQDVAEGSWAYEQIEYIAEHGIVQGYDDGYYRPATIVRRDQMAVYVARSICDPTGEGGLAAYTPPETPTFVDVATDHWAFKHIEYCAGRDIVQGYGKDVYMPDVAVTRAQMAVYVARAFELPM